MKKTTIVYAEWIELIHPISNDIAGKIFKDILSFANGIDTPPNDDPIWNFIRMKLVENLTEWEKIREERIVASHSRKSYKKKHQMISSDDKEHQTTSSDIYKVKVKVKVKDKDKDKDKELYPHLKNIDFEIALKSYLSTRKVKATDRAKQLILKKLHEYDVNTAIEMINQSVMNDWRGIFELKRGSNGRCQGDSGTLKIKSEPGKYDGISERL